MKKGLRKTRAKKTKKEEPAKDAGLMAPEVQDEVKQVGPVDPKRSDDEPIESSTICASCKHDGSKHYGGDKNWCNTPGCGCLGMIKK